MEMPLSLCRDHACALLLSKKPYGMQSIYFRYKASQWPDMTRCIRWNAIKIMMCDAAGSGVWSRGCALLQKIIPAGVWPYCLIRYATRVYTGIGTYLSYNQGANRLKTHDWLPVLRLHPVSVTARSARTDRSSAGAEKRFRYSRTGLPHQNPEYPPWHW